MSDDRKIVLNLTTDGGPIDVPSNPPLQYLKIEVLAQDPKGKEEVVLLFTLDFRKGQGQPPKVDRPPG